MAAAAAPMTDVAASSSAADSGVMRIYVHSVASDAWGPAWPVHSWAVSVCTGASSPSLRKIKQLFKEELMRVTNMDKALLRLPIMTVGVLKRADGREISNENDAGVRVSDVLEDREDVFFELKGAPEQPAPSQKHKGGAAMAAKAAAASSSSSSSSSSPGISVSSNGSGGQTITFDRSPNQPLSPMEQLVYQQLLHARELQGKGQLKKARDIYLQLLSSIPSEAGKGKPTTAQAEHAQSARQICHQQLGVIYLYNKQYEQARPQLEAAVKIVTSGASEANAAIVRQIGKTPQPELAQLIALVGQCYHGLGDFSEAQTHFERALKLLTPRGEESSSDANIQATIKETKVWLARALYRGNHAERAQALNIFEKLIAEDEHHIAALTYYAQIAIECGRKGEVIPYLLRALVAAQAAGATTNKGAASYEANILGRPPKPAGGAELDPQLVELIQVLLTDLVMLPDGVKTLFSELHAASSNHAALTFLAQTVKDQGGVTAAIEIYKRALAKCELDARGQASLLLNLVHTEELEYRYNEAFGRIRDYMQRNPDLRVGQLRVGDFAAAIGAIDDVYDVRLRTNSHPDVPQWCEVGKIFDEGTLHVTVPDPNAPPPKKSTATPYPADELQVLALMFTAVKMLYVCGGLQVLPALVNMLEPLRVDRDLHLTLIRNEHAYVRRHTNTRCPTCSFLDGHRAHFVSFLLLVLLVLVLSVFLDRADAPFAALSFARRVGCRWSGRRDLRVRRQSLHVVGVAGRQAGPMCTTAAPRAATGHGTQSVAHATDVQILSQEKLGGGTQKHSNRSVGHLQFWRNWSVLNFRPNSAWQPCLSHANRC
jgi:tetratricopeptide (TPR) repeat protein